MNDAAASAQVFSGQVFSGQWPYAVATLLFAAGMWLLLPHGRRSGRQLGAGLTFAGLALLTLLVHFGLAFVSYEPTGAASARMRPELTATLPRLGTWADDIVFLALAAVTVGSAVGAVTLRSPVYCAIWFALTLLGTAALFLYQGAQFLGIATIIVYAGAILVTFLFVLMLAQPEGHAPYDRVSWEGMLSACAGAVFVGMITMATAAALNPKSPETLGKAFTSDEQLSPEARDKVILADQHVPRLGGELFSKHLVSVEVAGTLLLVALVGAVGMILHSEQKKRNDLHDSLSSAEAPPRHTPPRERVPVNT
jgi:NADH-quinone oxidoreductase subunit J